MSDGVCKSFIKVQTNTLVNGFVSECGYTIMLEIVP